MGNLSRESRRDTKVEYLDKLAFMARSQGGARAIETDSKFEILFNLLNDRNDDTSVRITTCSVLEALAHQSRHFTDDRFSTVLNLLDDENSNAGVKIAIRDVLGAIIRNGHIVRDNVTAPTIYRLIVDSDKELQMAGLKALGGFWVGNIPPKASAIICKLVVPMLKDRYGVQRQIAVMALCSCVHKCMASFQDFGVQSLLTYYV
ncbi:hypothetical protein BD779DRAFT_300495 [Infundibulicybe gibba]|nr:hypothetical protein BD779DRAFT_300495 [Infundibulicybe gibba]